MKQNNSRTFMMILAIFIGLMCILCVCVSAIGGYTFYQFSRQPEISSLVDEIIATATATPQPKINRNPLPLPAATDLPNTETLLLETDVPQRDLRLLAGRLKYGGQELPAVVNDTPPTYAVGDCQTFWLSDDSGTTPRQFQSDACLQKITDHSYWWVEKGFKVNADDLGRSAQIFETKTYPTNRAFFGTEWTPGVDNDVRLSIFLGNVPGVGGYFASLNEFSSDVNPYSNQKEMFFINLRAMQPGGDYFDGVLAHEFQHMIHWNQDRNEETWANEGLSELASHLNGYDTGDAYTLYLAEPDLQLTAWGDSPNESMPYYGASYLFMVYFLEQFGEETLKAVVANPYNGIQGFNHVLQKQGYGQTFDDVFADFALANYLDDSTWDKGQWGYQTFSPGERAHAEQIDFPGQQQSTVHQYGVDYLEFMADAPFTLHFTGSTSISLVDNTAASGDYQWYSNRGDDSNTSLTRIIDLSPVQTATLTYKTWYDIEEDWDYAYLEVSTDGGTSWQLVEAPHSRNTNPSGNAYGPGYTGSSDGWLAETVDLTPYAGQKIWLRFEYITDDAINAPGFTVDDIAIPEIGFFDDAESPGNNGWIAEGFIKTNNLLQQNFKVLLVQPGNTPAVTPISLDATNTGTFIGPESGAYTLIVIALAPVTTEVAGYEYRIISSPQP